MNAEEEQWDNPAGVEDYHVPFAVLANREASEAALAEDVAHRVRVAEANLAVTEALARFQAQKWYVTAYAKVRFGIFWASYKVRLVLGLFLVKMLTKNPMNDPRLVSQKVWRRLGI